jgi:hypothetical protein
MFSNKTDSNPDKLRGQGFAEKFRMAKTAEFLYGALHPEEAVREGLDVKFPSDLPVPTACIRTTGTYPINTGAAGNVFINYVPGGLLTYNYTNGEQSNIVVNNTCTPTTAGSNNFIQQPYFPVPQVYDRWRLVAAEARVEYNGTVLSQAGKQYSCVHYEPIAIAYKGVAGAGTLTLQTQTYLDRLSGNLALVKSGLWNDCRDVTKDPIGRTHLFTPDSSVYSWNYAVGTGGGNYLVCGNNASAFTASTTSAATTSLLAGNATGSNNRQYSWYFTNLTPNVESLTLIIYEIYEFMPDIGAVGILKLEENISYEYNEHLNASMIKKATEGKSHGWKKVKDMIFNRLSSAGEVILPKLLNSVLAMI